MENCFIIIEGSARDVALSCTTTHIADWQFSEFLLGWIKVFGAPRHHSPKS